MSRTPSGSASVLPPRRHSARTPPENAPAAGSSLPWRVFSAALFLPLLVVLAFVGGWPYLAFVEAVVVLGLLEFYRMAQAKGAWPHTVPGVLAGACLVLLLYLGHGAAAGLLVTTFSLVVLVMELRRGRPEGSILNVGATVLGVFYVGWLGGHLGLLRTLPAEVAGPGPLPFGAGPGPDTGARVVLFTFLVTWAGDTGAYFVGRARGRTPLFPAVSPKKTAEGTAGGMFASMLAGILGGLWVLPRLGIQDSILLGAVGGIVGPIGDLVESLFKRDSGLKDAGRTIPGHGGVLDRFDSLLFVAPVFYYYFKYMVFRG